MCLGVHKFAIPRTSDLASRHTLQKLHPQKWSFQYDVSPYLSRVFASKAVYLSKRKTCSCCARFHYDSSALRSDSPFAWWHFFYSWDERCSALNVKCLGVWFLCHWLCWMDSTLPFAAVWLSYEAPAQKALGHCELCSELYLLRTCVSLPQFWLSLSPVPTCACYIKHTNSATSWSSVPVQYLIVAHFWQKLGLILLSFLKHSVRVPIIWGFVLLEMLVCQFRNPDDFFVNDKENLKGLSTVFQGHSLLQRNRRPTIQSV